MAHRDYGPMQKPPDHKSVIGASSIPCTEKENEVISELDIDKLSDLAKCLFSLNNRHYGPIPGAYLVVCTKSGEEWCVGQLNVDREKPIILFDDKVFSSPKMAKREALRLKRERGESMPRRSI